MSAGAPRSVLVTGGTGYLGSAIVAHLVERGQHVQVMARSGADVPGPALRHAADLTDQRAVHAACAAAGREARARGAMLDLIHCAASISYRRRDAEELRRVNVEGTRTVLAAARAAGVRRFCHVSSVAAIGAAPDARTILDDRAPLAVHELGCVYGATKREAEALVLAEADRLDVVVASPCAVFGPALRRSNTLEFLGFLAAGSGAGRLLACVAPPGAISVVGREDAARGVVLVLERGERGERYLLVESAWDLRDLLELVLASLGRKGPRARVPPGLWSLLVGLARLVDRVRPLERATPDALGLLGLHFRFHAARARLELGWEPRPFREVLAETLGGLATGAPAGSARGPSPGA